MEISKEKQIATIESMKFINRNRVYREITIDALNESTKKLISMLPDPRLLSNSHSLHIQWPLGKVNSQKS